MAAEGSLIDFLSFAPPTPKPGTRSATVFARVHYVLLPESYIRVFHLEPDIAILYRFVLQNEKKTKYYPTPSGNRARAS